MSDTKEQTLLVIDSGLFTHIAEALAPHFARTMYFSEWVRSGFPQEKHARIGDLPGIERVKDVYAAILDADLVVFPDVVTANLASYVKKIIDTDPEIVKRYFGTTKHAAELELDRWGFRDVLREAGLPVPEATKVVGVDDLKKVLKAEKDVYVKYGRFRGDLETFHHDVWFTTEQWFDDTVRHLGPSAHEAEFIIEEPIKGVEVGVDAYFNEGWPNQVLWGYELKDAGYIGRISDYSDLPSALRKVNERMSSVLTEREHKGWISTENRVAEDGTPYLIDPCMRCGSPPSEIQSLTMVNLADVVAGNTVESSYRGRFVAELILKSEFAVEHFLALDIKPAAREMVKIHNHTVIDGKDYVVPVGISEIGAACGYGDTLEEACKMAKKAAEGIKAYELDYDGAAFDDIEEIIEKGRSCGIEWA